MPASLYEHELLAYILPYGDERRQTADSSPKIHEEDEAMRFLPPSGPLLISGISSISVLCPLMWMSIPCNINGSAGLATPILHQARAAQKRLISWLPSWCCPLPALSQAHRVAARAPRSTISISQRTGSMYICTHWTPACWPHSTAHWRWHRRLCVPAWWKLKERAWRRCVRIMKPKG